MFLKISQNSKGKPRARVYLLIHVQESISNFIKREDLAQVLSCEFCKIFKGTIFNTLFYKKPPATASIRCFYVRCTSHGLTISNKSVNLKIHVLFTKYLLMNFCKKYKLQLKINYYPFHPSVAFHTEPSLLLTSFYIKRNTELKWVKVNYCWNIFFWTEKNPSITGFLYFNALKHLIISSNIEQNIDTKWVNPLSANPTKCSNILKQLVGCCQRIVWVCLTILKG